MLGLSVVSCLECDTDMWVKDKHHKLTGGQGESWAE